MLEIRVDGTEILSHPRDLSLINGLYVARQGLQGWGGLPAGRREALALAVQHGELDVPVYLPSRVITIDGHIIAPSEYKIDNLAKRLTGIGAPGGQISLSVDHRGTTLTARARRILAEVDETVTRHGRHLRCGFQLQLVCADPRQYGDWGTLPGDRLIPPDPGAVATSIDVDHRGNFPAYPVVAIPSAPAAWTVSAGGRTFSVSGATAGGVHTADLRSGRVYRNGVEMPGVGQGALWTVPAGQGLLHTLSAPGRVRIQDTFV